MNIRDLMNYDTAAYYKFISDDQEDLDSEYDKKSVCFLRKNH